MKRKSNNYVLLFLIVFMLMIAYGCGTNEKMVKKSKDNHLSKALPELTLIKLKKDKVIFKANSSFDYTLYKPEDPFKIIVNLNGILPGKFSGKIEGNKDGVIVGVKATHVKMPIEGTKIEIMLSQPVILSPEIKKGEKELILIVKTSEEEKLEFSEEKVKIEEITKNNVEKEEVISEKVEQLKEEEQEEPLAEYIEKVDMEERDGAIVVIIKGDGRMVPNIFPLEGKLVVDLPGVDMRADIPKEVIKPLKGIRWGEHKDKIRIVLDLESNTAYDVVSINDKVEITLRSPELLSKKEEKKEELVKELKEEKLTLKEEKEEEIEIIEGKYTGKRISLDFQNADIVPIFRLLADVSGYNIVVDPQVKGKITMKLINVPWDQALDIILKTHNLDKVIEGNIIRIAPADKLAREKEAKARILAAQKEVEPLVTQVFPVSYADVNKVKEAIESAKVLSNRGNVSTDERISSLIIKDIESNMEKVKNLIETLDRPIPQVMIEARIVEVNSDAASELGIQWGFFSNSYDKLIGVKGSPNLGEGGVIKSPFMIDFPAAVGKGGGAGLTFGFLNATRTFGLDMQLSAIETAGKGKIISNPRIITTDNQSAKILQGESLPYPQQTSEGTVSAAFKDVALSIEVIPHITPDKSIIMDINVIKEDLVGFVNIGAGQAPRTTKLEGKTKVLIKNGETLVIGGIYKKSKRESEAGLPGIKDIPLLGWLFKRSKVEENTNEIIIFLTPRIIENLKIQKEEG